LIDKILLQAEILWPALLAGILVLSTHIPLGQEVLRRGIIFLDLAIAQVAMFGLIAASYLGIDVYFEHGHSLQNLFAIVAAVLGAMLIYKLRRYDAKIQEALIGILFILAATGSILLLSQESRGGERLKELLVGQILWVQAKDLVGVGILYVFVISFWLDLKNKMESIFYPLFAITITFSTQLVGVYLVFASLIIPALATYRDGQPFIPAWAIGIIGYASGLVISALMDLPSGATIAWCLTITAGLYTLIKKLRTRTSSRDRRYYDYQ
jgi:zinc/manganese transport system permease protein